MGITGKRRLLFGLFSVAMVGVIELAVAGGMSVNGQVTMGVINALFYGNSAVDKFKNGQNDGKPVV